MLVQGTEWSVFVLTIILDRGRKAHVHMHPHTKKKAYIKRPTYCKRDTKKAHRERDAHCEWDMEGIYRETDRHMHVLRDTYRERDQDTYKYRDTCRDKCVPKDTPTKRHRELWSEGPRENQNNRDMQRCADGVRDKERDRKKDTYGYAQAEGENSERQKHSLTKRWWERDRKREKDRTSVYLKNNMVMKRGFKC